MAQYSAIELSVNDLTTGQGVKQDFCPFKPGCEKFSDLSGKWGIGNTIELCYEGQSMRMHPTEPSDQCVAEARFDEIVEREEALDA